MSDNAVVHIVDDDEAARQSLAFLLTTAGMAVRLYPSATAFLDAIGDMQPGCLVTDVRMPDMTGIELLKTLKAKGRALPTIVITGHGDIALAVEAMKAGALDFIEKPFEEEAMLDRRAIGKGTSNENGRHCQRRPCGDPAALPIAVHARAPSSRWSDCRQPEQGHRPRPRHQSANG